MAARISAAFFSAAVSSLVPFVLSLMILLFLMLAAATWLATLASSFKCELYVLVDVEPLSVAAVNLLIAA